MGAFPPLWRVALYAWRRSCTKIGWSAAGSYNQTVFLEDRIHDWNWAKGRFRFYTRVASETADVIVAYATETVTPTAEQIAAMTGTRMNFDPMTGEPLAGHRK